MKVYISIISHEHAELINRLDCIDDLAECFQVVLKSNTENDDFQKLENKKNFHWINRNYFRGFGHNNNIVFNYCMSKLGMVGEDFFVVLNPDVKIEVGQINSLISAMVQSGSEIAAINLYKDTDKKYFDESVRKFPTLVNFAKSFLGLGNESKLDKTTLKEPVNVDWAAGSFLAFRASHYRKLGGFDEAYFMYCEDIDICYRSMKLGHSVVYFPSIEAIHFAKHANRKVFSKHFVWHLKSTFRFLLTKINMTTPKSSIH